MMMHGLTNFKLKKKKEPTGTMTQGISLLVDYPLSVGSIL
jgi:hypothetical protein